MGEKCLDGAKMEIVSTGLFVWILFSGSVHSESFFLSLVASKLNVGEFLDAIASVGLPMSVSNTFLRVMEFLLVTGEHD